MSLSAHDRKALDSIEEEIAVSAPELASLLALFSRLTAGEELPEREQVGDGRRRAARPGQAWWQHPCRGSARLAAGPRVRNPGWLLAVLWLALTVSGVLIATVLLASRGGGGCTAWPAACVRRPPAPATPSSRVPAVPGRRTATENKTEGPVLSTAPGQAAFHQPAVFLRPAVFPVTRVVVGVDGSAGSVAALYWASAEAVRCQAGLRIVSAWQEPAHSGGSLAGHPAQAAALIAQEALARILGEQHYPRRIGCAALRGAPGQALLSRALDTGLVVLGTTGNGTVPVPGATGRYCLQHGCGPLVLVSASSA